jgi:steroid delta-isomerase-like uncharacterized protein
MTSLTMDPMLQSYAAAWAQRDTDYLLSFFTEDGIYEDAALGIKEQGHAAIKAFFEDLFRAFPDFTIEVVSGFVAADYSGSEWIMSGTHQGDLPDLPATGKKFSVRGASIKELSAGKIRRNTDYWDQVTFLRQLGVLPPA